MIVREFANYNKTHLVATHYLEKGESVPLHKHDWPHDAFVAHGTVEFDFGGLKKIIEAPEAVHFPQGGMHGYTALSDSALVVATHEYQYIKEHFERQAATE